MYLVFPFTFPDAKKGMYSAHSGSRLPKYYLNKTFEAQCGLKFSIAQLQLSTSGLCGTFSISCILKNGTTVLGKGRQRGNENTSAFTSQLQQANLTVFANNLHCFKFILGDLRQRSDFGSICKLNKKRLCCWLFSPITKCPNQPIRYLLISFTIE